MLFRFIFLLVVLLAFSTNSPRIAAERVNGQKILIVGSGINGAATAFFLQGLMQEEWRHCCIALNLKGTPTAFGKIVNFWKNKTSSSSSSSPLSDLERKYEYDCEHVNCDSDDDRAVEIDVVEQDSVIGGRVKGFRDPSSSIIELGASVYHKVNQYLSYFAEDLLIARENEEHKKHRDFSPIETLQTHPYLNSKVGVWKPDESTFFFKEHPTFTFKTIFDVLWRYQLDPHYVSKCVDASVEKLNKIYKGQLLNRKSFKTAEELLEKIGLLEMTRKNMTTYFAECAGVKEDHLFMQELAQAFTKINYGQGLELSALAGSVALKGRGDEVFGVEGGNFRIIETLMKHAGVSPGRQNLIMNTKVVVEKNPENGQIFLVFLDNAHIHKKMTKRILLDDSDYSAVILAYPNWASIEDMIQETRSNGKNNILEKENIWVAEPKKMKGKRTHTTIVEASGCWNSAAFGIDSQEQMPTVLISSSSSNSFFRSIGNLRRSNSTSTSGKSSSSSSCVFKIFSDEKIESNNNNQQLAQVFSGDIKILSATEWNAAYPILTPNSPEETFDQIIYNENAAVKKKIKKKKHSFILGKSKKKGKPILYAGALEYAVSTMETQAISAMNTALLLRDLWGGAKLSEETKKQLEKRRKNNNDEDL